MRPPVLRFVAALVAVHAPRIAQADEREPATEVVRDAVPTSESRAFILPEHLAQRRGPYWMMGVGAEMFGTATEPTDAMVGVTTQFRTRDYGGHLIIEGRPNVERYQDTRLLIGLGFRLHWSVFGARFSYGVGVHGEVRLEDHFWLFQGTPAELGGVLFSNDTWELELFAGGRHVIAGSLIQHFLIDPNGFDNENAQDELDDLKGRWVGFARLVFSRRID